jgi:hypothetical protein
VKEVNSWRIVGQIASGFGIVFILFAAFSAFINYQAITIQSGSFISASYLQVYILNAMLPFLLYAVLSFLIAVVTLHATGGAKKAEAPRQEEIAAELPPETAPAETQAE